MGNFRAKIELLSGYRSALQMSVEKLYFLASPPTFLTHDVTDPYIANWLDIVCYKPFIIATKLPCFYFNQILTIFLMFH